MKTSKIEDGLKKNERQPEKNGRQPKNKKNKQKYGRRHQTKMEDDLKKWKTTSSTILKINLNWL